MQNLPQSLREMYASVSPEDAALMERDLMLFGSCYAMDGKRVAPADVLPPEPEPGPNEIISPWRNLL